METGTILINGIFYIFLTTFFIYIFIKEKAIVKKINFQKERFGNFIIDKFNIKNNILKKILKGTVHYTETIGTALILVLIIQRFYLGNF
ncbi:MAG: signal peptidase I, partial [Cetobacterium sp.]